MSLNGKLITDCVAVFDFFQQLQGSFETITAEVVQGSKSYPSIDVPSSSFGFLNFAAAVSAALAAFALPLSTVAVSRWHWHLVASPSAKWELIA